ncbi:MAG: GNAT family N-acetyltransferase [Acidobacteriota bacterium]
MFQSETRRKLIEAALSQISLPSGISIRSWAESDFSAVQRLASEQGWLTQLEQPRQVLKAWRQSWPTLIAVQGETVVGFLRGFTDGVLTTCVAEILVAPEWQDKGVGKALVETCHRLFPSTRFELLTGEIGDALNELEGFLRFEGLRKVYR